MKVALALGGGSVRGFAHLGVIEALKKNGIEFDFIVGTSAGGIVGSLYAWKGDVDECFRILEDAAKSEVVREMRLQSYKVNPAHENYEGRIQRFLNTIRGTMLLRKSMTHISMVEEETIERFFSLIFPEDLTFEDLGVPVSVVALDLISGRDVVIGKGRVLPAVRATSAIPGLLPPVKMDGMMLVDGGTTQKVPVESAYLLGADRVIAVDVGRDPLPDDPLSSGLEVMWRAEDWSNHRLHLKQLSLADVVIKPDISHIDWYDTGSTEFLFHEGFKAAVEKMDEVEKALSESFISRLFRRRKKTYFEPIGKYVVIA